MNGQNKEVIMFSIIVGIITKVITWVKANIATLVDAIQLVIKGLKTIATAILNLLSLIMPASAAEKAVLAIRGFLEIFDQWIESWKINLIPKV